MKDYIVPALAGLIGIVATYLAAILKFQKDLAAEYDKDLRGNRIRAYLKLWALLQPLAKYARPGRVTHASLGELGSDLRRWYFEEGGLFLSEKSRDAYFALQNEIQAAMKHTQTDRDRELDDSLFEKLRKKGSKVRTSTANDVGTRKPSELAGD
jgi:hypothetical protein